MQPNHALGLDTRTRLSVLFAFVLLGSTLASSASAQKGSFEVGAGLGLLRLDDNLGGDSGTGLDLRLGYHLTDRFEIQLQSLGASSILDGSFRTTTLNVVYNVSPARRFVPYGILGFGRAEVELDPLRSDPVEDDGTALRAAIGGRFHIGPGDRAFVRLELGTLHERTFDRSSTHWGLTGVVSWRFGRGVKARP